ncbi:magnesium transporter NIPA-domain-containing protein [Catenaria anguillulae PL171]|uniref:Magnesium transporter NIPA-domain-containing protein n=1 Tax=Catenaria anguillulae PL171 TaxID=765915 RepID=A0A1Y2I365_9FUNG|nr:magnesium transporter NIPA-domain-containing protein [Catenaria anguillulae PL171]
MGLPSIMLAVTSSIADVERELPSLIGILVAVSGNLLISIALNIQKYAHLRAAAAAAAAGQSCASPTSQSSNDDIPHSPASAEAAASRSMNEPLLGRRSPGPEGVEGGGLAYNDEKQHYTRKPIWWLGVVLMLLGETGNFMAYGFAPASVIAPLGTVALISNAIIAPTFLGESFRRRDLVGVLLAICGTVIIVTNGKSSEEQLDSTALLAAVFSFRFGIYTAVCAGLFAFLMSIYERWHMRTVLVDLTLVALYGGWTVLSTKAISTLLGGSWFLIFTLPIFYPLFVIMVATGILQIRYLNTALSLFDSTVVIPTQFVLFTISAIAGSSVLYNDFEEQSPGSVIAFLFGCTLTFVAVYLIGSKREPSAVIVASTDPPAVLGIAEVAHERNETYVSAIAQSPGAEHRSIAQRPQSVTAQATAFSRTESYLSPADLSIEPSRFSPASSRPGQSPVPPLPQPQPSTSTSPFSSPIIGKPTSRSPNLPSPTTPHFVSNFTGAMMPPKLHLSHPELASPPSTSTTRTGTPRGSNPYLPTVAARVPLAAYSAGIWSPTSSAPGSAAATNADGVRRLRHASASFGDAPSAEREGNGDKSEPVPVVSALRADSGSAANGGIGASGPGAADPTCSSWPPPRRSASNSS